MAAKILKYTAVPAAAIVGLGSFRFYAISDKNNEEQISPRQLSIYSPDRPSLQFMEEQPGVLQTGLGTVRTGLQPYVRAVQSAITSVRDGVTAFYHAGEDTYYFLRDPPPGFFPRVGVISVAGLGGLILARKGSRLKKIVLPLGLATIGTAVCYPTQTVGALKITGKKVYTVSSSVASLFKSKPKEDVIMPAPAAPVTTSPEPVAPIKAFSEVTLQKVVEGATPASEVVSAVESDPSASVPVADIVLDVAPNEMASVSEVALDHPSVVTSETDVLSSESEPEPAAEIIPEPPIPDPVVAPAPEVAPADTVPETTHEPTPEVTVPVIEPATIAPTLAENPTTPPSAAEVPPSTEPVTVKSRFVPDPALLDHGQANPEDADMYSTRS